MSTEIDALKARVKQLESRLEMDRAFRWDDEAGDLVCFEVEPGSIPDGIECRDATIQLLDDEIERLSVEVVRLRDALLEIEVFGPGITHGWAAAVRSIARAALTKEPE